MLVACGWPWVFVRRGGCSCSRGAVAGRGGAQAFSSGRAFADSFPCSGCAATQLFKLLEKYKKEEKAAKKERLKAMAGGAKSAKPYFVKCGINHVTKLIESKRAKLVVIAHDVDPIEVRRVAPTRKPTATRSTGSLPLPLRCPALL